ncbi:MAG: hypothetical protein ABIA63_09245, partial [bacterium]
MQVITKIFAVLSAVVLVVNLSSVNSANVTIDGSQEYQTIEGLGGCEGWIFPPNTLYSEIFDDLGVSMLRFRMLRYTESKPDENNEARDNDNDDPFVIDWSGVDTSMLKYIAPLLQAAQSRGVKLIGTIFSPPSWMKTNGVAEQGGYLKSGYEDELVEFILIWVKAIEKYHGIHVDYVSIQNEPNTTCCFTSYSSSQLRDIIKLLGARFEAEGVTTGIYSPDISGLGAFSGYVNTICGNPVAMAYVDRLATHNYTANFWNPDGMILQLTSAYNLANSYGKKLWLTEYCDDQSNYGTWNEGLALVQHLHDALVYGQVSAWLTYEIYRDPSGKAFSIYDDSGQITPKFYHLKQYFRYVRPGAVRVETASSDTDILVTSFVHNDSNTFTVAAINRSSSNQDVTFGISNISGLSVLDVIRTSSTENADSVDQVIVSGNSFNYILPDSSITTFTGAISNPVRTDNVGIRWGNSMELMVSPNPFSLSTTMTYKNNCNPLNIAIYDISGNLINNFRNIKKKS